MASRVLASLFVVCLIVEGCVAVTLTSKLIHRFSEEAKAVWGSRYGNAAMKMWPKHRSMEYYRLLLSNDWKRQKMKVGSQYQLLFPSQGSQTLFFGNDFAWLHYTWIDIGTPNVSFLVALDAGSDLLWVPCDCIQCAPLSASYYNVLDRDLSEYSPSISSTSKHLSCSHQSCELGPNCKSPKDPCPYKVNYYTENTSSSGFLIEEKLHMASGGEHTNQTSVQASVIIGCGRKQSGSYLDGAAPDGLMGLGLGEISVPSILAKAGLIQNSFSLCFDEDYSGRVFFGDQGLATQQSTPFLPLEGKYVTYLVGVDYYCVGNSCLKQTGFQALVDSGTSFTFLPREVYNQVVMEIDKQVKGTRSTLDGDSSKYCYNASSQELLNIPAMALGFSMNQSFVIRNPIYSISVKQGFNLFCLGIQPIDGNIGVIGQNFMIGYRLVFDRDKMKLGWSHTRCQDLSDSARVHLAPPPSDRSPNPLPTNEQQRTPNSHPVSPAVAEKAPSKPSAASPLFIPSWLCLVSLLRVLI